MPTARGEKIVMSVPRSCWSLIWAGSIRSRISSSVILRSARVGKNDGSASANKLRLSVISQLLRFGRVVAVAIDNHEVFLSVRSCSRGRASLLRVF